jgi:hypothetical protein
MLNDVIEAIQLHLHTLSLTQQQASMYASLCAMMALVPLALQCLKRITPIILT